MSPNQTTSAALRWEFWKAFGATFCVFFTIAALLPVLPQVLAARLHASGTAIGLEMAQQAVGAILSRFVAGWLIAHRGSRYCLVVGTAMAILSGLLFALPISFFTIGMARFFQGAGEGLCFTSGMAWVLNEMPEEERGRNFALFGLSLWLGSTIAPPIGAYCFGRLGTPTLPLLSTSVAAIGAVLVATMKPVHVYAAERRENGWFAAEALLPGAMMAIACFGFAAIATFSPLFYVQQGWTHPAMPITAFGAGFVSIRLFGGTLIDRFRPVRVAATCCVLGAAGLGSIALARHGYSGIIGSYIAGVGMALVFPALAIEAAAGVAPVRRGTVMGWYTAFWDLSLALGNVALGAVTSHFGYRSGFVAASASALAAGFGLALWDRWRGASFLPRPQEPFVE